MVVGLGSLTLLVPLFSPSRSANIRVGLHPHPMPDP